MFRQIRSGLGSWAVLGTLVCAGCGGGSSTTPPATLPVTGKVLFKGEPLTGGKIMFEPQGPGREAFGTIQKDGTFSLSTYGENDGAVPGSHRISVTGPAGKGSRAIPKKYSNYESSKLEMDVNGDKKEYTITLE